ncbi:hypothetical protein VT84_37515 [Gemmata sp. SH-PL17]|uniref:hypothetical protein n=1 Tax=Gemmata sp. SH-PL17 TaxID=1630693 RepID=UPI00078E7ED2|nr:hypothetical protein [Gemmata sp. SH-PL17]AMV30152.1 hypothetical protein VT84_37515 [Gemmata sp. SH-PL17]
MPTPADLLAAISKARTQLRDAEREEAEARKALRAATDKLKAANKRYLTAIDEALDENRQPGLFDLAEPAPAIPVPQSPALEDTTPEPVVRLMHVPNFPDVVFDTLFAQGVSTVPTLIERVDEATKGIALPLRNRVVTYLVKLKVKIKPAENAADAIAAHLEPKNAPVGTHLASVPGFPVAALGPLADEGVRTVEDLDAKVAEMRTKSAHREATRYSALRSLGLGEALVLAADKLVDHFAPKLDKTVKVIDVLNLPKPKRVRKSKAVAQ